MVRRSAWFVIAGLLFVLLLACEPELEPAPADIDGVSHWLWVNFETADDASLDDAIDKAYKAADFDHFSEHYRGLLSDLTSAELAGVGMEDRDPKPAQGMYFVNMFDCDLAKMNEILYAKDQDVMYPEVYDTYTRSYTSDLAAYTAGESNTITWDLSYQATPLPSASYVAHSKGGLRYLGHDPEIALSHGPVVMQRIYMPQPAEYLDTDANEFLFDFQIELYIQSAPGRIAHFFPIWRHLAFNGVGASTDDNWVIDTIIDALIDWDTRSQELCAAE